MMIVEIAIPKGYQALDVAKTLTTYLLGSGALDNGDLKRGPFRLSDGEERWQLDSSNDYWFRAEGRIGRLSCRYGGKQERVIQAMATLFQTRWGPETE